MKISEKTSDPRKLAARPTTLKLALAAAVTLAPGAGFAADTINCVFPFWFGFAPVFVAQEKGYFAEEDLEVSTAFDNDRANVLPAMDNGSIDCTMRTLGEDMSRPRTAETTGTVIGTIDISVGADGVVSAGDINSVADLIGKTFAGEINHPGTVLLQYALTQMGHSIDEVNVKLIATDDSAAVFEDPSIAAVATWEPMMSAIVNGTSREGAKILISSADYEGLIIDVIIVRSEDYAENPAKYAAFLRGIYRAVDLYQSNPEEFVAISAPYFSVPEQEMTDALTGVKYTSYEEALTYMPGDGNGELRAVFDAFNGINMSLDLQDAPLDYAPYVDDALLQGLFDGKTR